MRIEKDVIGYGDTDDDFDGDNVDAGNVDDDFNRAEAFKRINRK